MKTSEGWGPDFGGVSLLKRLRYTERFYVGQYRREREIQNLSIEKSDFSAIAGGKNWFYLFDFPDGLEQGFPNIMDSAFFQAAILSE